MKIKLAALLVLLPLSMHAATLAVIATPSGATLSWTASATPSTTVNVYRCSGVSCTTFTKIATGQAAGGPYVDSTVTSGAYSYYVTAVGVGGESAPSNTATYTLAPLPPTGLTAQ